MRLITTLAVLLFCASACERIADKVTGIPTYTATRDWVDKHCPTTAVPKDARIYVGHDTPPQHAGIIRYHPGINLREIIDQTPFKSTSVTVYVMRQTSGQSTESEDFVTVKPSEEPEFEVKPLDVIWVWVYDGTPTL